MGDRIAYCGFCNEYICENLKDHFLIDQEAKVRLEEIRRIAAI